MSKVSTEYYSGLPVELWDNLIIEAEDLLVEEEIGNHILGIYPAGTRMYGIESSSQGLLCLYVDTVESLLDPLFTRKENEFYHIGHQLSPIYFVEIHDWVKWLLSIPFSRVIEDEKILMFFDLIPCFHDVFHQDNSIDKIISFAQKYLLENYHFSIFNRNGYTSKQELIELILNHRTLLLWLKTGIFNPSLFNNKDYDSINDFLEQESYLKYTVKENIITWQIDDQLLSDYLFALKNEIFKHKPLRTNDNKIAEDLRSETIKLYKGLV